MKSLPENPYVVAVCQACGARSPEVDQRADPRRTLASEWFKEHKRKAHPIGVYWVQSGWTCIYCGERIPGGVWHNTVECENASSSRPHEAAIDRPLRQHGGVT